MTQEDQDRFDEIVNRFEKMDHSFQALQPKDALFLINQVARLSKDTVKSSKCRKDQPEVEQQRAPA